MKSISDLLYAAANSISLWRDVAIAVLFGLLLLAIWMYVETTS